MSVTATRELMDFYRGLPHWVADAGLSATAAQGVADDLESLVETLQDAGYPPAEVGGPDPSSFPPPSNRIAAASNQINGLLEGLDDEGWETEVGDQSIAEHCTATQGALIERATNP